MLLMLYPSRICQGNQVGGGLGHVSRIEDGVKGMRLGAYRLCSSVLRLSPRTDL